MNVIYQQEDESTTTTTTESTTTTTPGPDLSPYNCCYLLLHAVTYCSVSGSRPAAYYPHNPSWGGDEYHCPPAGYGSYADGVYTSSSESWNHGLRIYDDITVNFSDTDGLSIHTLSATHEETCADESQGCYGIASRTCEISASDIPCEELRDSSGKNYVLCEIDGGDVASHVDVYSSQTVGLDSDDNEECSSAYNDFTLVSNEYFHNNTPYIRLYLRTTQE